MFNWKRAAAIATAALCVCVTGACSKDETASGGGKITLTYMNIFTDAGPLKDTTAKVIKDFEAKHPNIKVANLATPQTQLSAKYKTLLASGSAPDLAELDGGISLDLIQQGAVQQVDPKALGYSSEAQLESAYIPGVLDFYRKSGKLYALPEEYSNYQPWVDTSAFKAAGVQVPKTWDDMCALGPKLLKKDSKGRVVRELMALPNDPAVQYAFLEGYTRSFAGAMFGGATYNTSQLTSKPVEDAFKMLQHLTYDCQATFPSINPAAAAGGDRQTYINGHTAMLFTGGSWLTGGLKGRLAPPVSKVYKNLAGPDGVVGNASYGYGFVVSNNSKHPAEAWELAKAISDAGNSFMANAGLFNGRKDVAKSAVAAKVPYWRTNWLPSLEASKYMAPYENTEIGTIVARAMTEVTTQHADVAKTLADADAQVKPLLAKRGR